MRIIGHIKGSDFTKEEAQQPHKPKPKPKAKPKKAEPKEKVEE